MNPTSVHSIAFSPTRTSFGIARAIAAGLAGEGRQPAIIDLTYGTRAASFPADAAVVFALPVYGGHAAPEALKRMAQLHGEGTPAVIAVVYGNRDIGSAAVELAAFVAERGFVPVAAGAFVGEHSYSTAATPIAAGRPDGRDLAEAEEFGRAVREKLASRGVEPVDVRKLRAPRTPLASQLRFLLFVLRYIRRQKKHPVVLLPTVDADKCTRCGTCSARCPVQAIARGDEPHTDPARCIRCCECVKRCPVGARAFDSPFAPTLARNFAQRKRNRTLL